MVATGSDSCRLNPWPRLVLAVPLRSRDPDLRRGERPVQGLLDRRWRRSWNSELWATTACHPGWGGLARGPGERSHSEGTGPRAGTSPDGETVPDPAVLTLWGRAGGCRCPPRPAAGPAPHTGRGAASSGRRPGPPRSAPPAPAGRPHRRRCTGRSLQLPSWGGEEQGVGLGRVPGFACGDGGEAGGSVRLTHFPGPRVPLGTWTPRRYSQPSPSALRVSPSCP